MICIMESMIKHMKFVGTACWFLVLALRLQETCEASMRSDYIVVGAGSAGSVVANRLSANLNNDVLLLEAGERPNLMSEVPNFYFYLQSTKYDWNYTVQMPSFPEYGIKLEPKSLPQGKVVGGTSNINAMIYIRGNKLDFNNWAQNGAVGWDWEEVLPFFKKSENNQDEDIFKNGFHGRKGEMFVQRPSFRTPLAAKYLQAAEELGYKLGDVNGRSQAVFMNPQLNVHDGRRYGANKAFTYPIEGRRNLRVLTSAFVRKVLFDGNRTIGVEIDHNGETKHIMANKEVILSAGAIKSPQILMLSGIGPKKELNAFGIPVISDLPVGKNFHDHAVMMVYSKDINKRYMSGLSMSEVDYNQFLFNGSGILSDISSEAVGYTSSKKKRNSLWPDIELIFSTFVQPKSFSRNPNSTVVPTSSCIAVLSRPKSRGEVTLKSVDPYEQPNIKPNYLTNKDDVNVMVNAIKQCRAFENSETMKDILTKSEEPQLDQCQNYSRESYEYLACTAMASVLPGYHLAGSCKMGDPKDPCSVVDPNLRVIGVEGLRVVDNSIMPFVVSGHTYAVAVMIGEKGAEYILKESISNSNIN